MWNTTQFGIHAGSDVCSHSVFTKAQSPNITTLPHLTAEHRGSVLRAEGPLRYLSQVLHDRSCERDQFGTEMNNYEAKLFFFKLQPVFFAKCSLEFDVCFMKHCHFVAYDKGPPNVF